MEGREGRGMVKLGVRNRDTPWPARTLGSGREGRTGKIRASEVRIGSDRRLQLPLRIYHHDRRLSGALSAIRCSRRVPNLITALLRPNSFSLFSQEDSPPNVTKTGGITTLHPMTQGNQLPYLRSYRIFGEGIHSTVPRLPQ